MTILSVDEIKEGMVLEADVKNFSGTPLLKAGSVITGVHLTAFKAWGVTEVAIRGAKAEEMESDGFENLDQATRRSLERELERFFMKNDLKNQVMIELYRVMRKRRVSALKNA